MHNLLSKYDRPIEPGKCRLCLSITSNESFRIYKEEKHKANMSDSGVFAFVSSCTNKKLNRLNLV